MDVKLFNATANDTCGGYFTKGKKYRVYRVVFPKSYPEGLFLVCCDNEEYKIVSSDFFNPIELA